MSNLDKMPGSVNDLSPQIDKQLTILSEEENALITTYAHTGV